MDLSVFKSLLDSIQTLIKRYPMLLLLMLIIMSYIPCLISVLIGGTFWVGKLNFGFVAFDYGAIPIFLTLSMFFCAPFMIYIYWDMKAFRHAQACEAKRLLDLEKKIIDDFKREQQARRIPKITSL